DYYNRPMNKAGDGAFVALVNAGRKVLPHDFEEPRYFESCMPIEVMAERGPETLRFGARGRPPRRAPWSLASVPPRGTADVEAPSGLGRRFELRSRPSVRFAGLLTGVEGY